MCRSPHRSFFIAYGHPLHPLFPLSQQLYAWRHTHKQAEAPTFSCIFKTNMPFTVLKNISAIYFITFFSRRSKTISNPIHPSEKNNTTHAKVLLFAPKQNNICCRNNDLKSQLGHFVEFESTFQVFAFVDICYLLWMANVFLCNKYTWALLCLSSYGRSRRAHLEHIYREVPSFCHCIAIFIRQFSWFSSELNFLVPKFIVAWILSHIRLQSLWCEWDCDVSIAIPAVIIVIYS